MVFVVSSFLYLHHDQIKSRNWEKTAIAVLNGVVDQYQILSVEERKDSKETAICFDTSIESIDREAAEKSFLSMFQQYDVDNYHLREEKFKNYIKKT